MSRPTLRWITLGLAMTLIWAVQVADASVAYVSNSRNFSNAAVRPALSITASAGAAPQVVDLAPVADAFVSASGANAGSNYGAAGALSIASGDLVKGEFQSVLRFDAAAAKSAFDATFGLGAWSIQGITLRLTAASPNNAIFNSPSVAGQFLASWMQRDDWIEGTGTPNAPTTNGITFGTLSSFLDAGDQSLGTFSFSGGTSGAATYVLTPAANFLADVTAGNLVSLRLSAPVPEPSSMLLLLVGAGASLPFWSAAIHRRFCGRR